MSDTAQAASVSPSHFAASMRRRGLRFAMLCGPAGAPPGQRVDAAVRHFLSRADARPCEQWPALFWSGLVVRSGEQDAPAGRGVDGALRRLPLPLRQAFLLRAWLDFPAPDAAHLLERSLPEFQRDLHHALQALRAELANGADGYRWVQQVRAELDRPPSPAGSAPRVGVRSAPAVHRGRRWFGAGLVGAGSVLALALLLRPPGPPEPQLDGPPMATETVTALPPADPLEQLLSLPAEDFELLESDTEHALLDDLAFHRWLEQQPSTDAR